MTKRGLRNLTLSDIRALYERYVPQSSRHSGARLGFSLWWPAHEIGHLLTVPRRNIGMPLFGLDNAGATSQETACAQAYELAAMSISRRLLAACDRPDLFCDELEASDYDVMHFGSHNRARRLLRKRRLLRLPRTRSGLETLCQRALAPTSTPREPNKLSPSI